MDETLFHLYLMQWLDDNNYSFWWEPKLPNSRLTPDFLAVSDNGRRLMIEAKVFQTKGLKQLLKYQEVLGDPDVEICLAFPDTVTVTHLFTKECGKNNVRILRIPCHYPLVNSYRHFLQRGWIPDFFPTYLPPTRDQLTVNQWGRLTLE